MATYSIRTTRQQEVGLQFAYDNYADHALYPDKQSYLQYRVSNQILNPMYAEQQAAQSASFDASYQTVPEASQPKAKTDIEAAIIANGGTIVPAGPTHPPSPLANPTGGIVPTARGTTSNPIQIGGTDKKPPKPVGPNGGGDNEITVSDDPTGGPDS